ncbi:MAG: antitoxin VapB family protein [Candidatus Thorarchaeota archaeon]
MSGIEMAKNIMISNEVYTRLRSIKRDDESFSDLIRRLLNYKKTSLLDLAGEWPFSRKVISEQEKYLEETWQKGW